MGRPLNYHTKQRDAILLYIESLGSQHITAAQVVAHFEKQVIPVGRTTIYRHLDKLTESGHLRRYTIDGVAGACFQYTEQRENCPAHLHLKCEGCGEITHLNCDMLDEIRRHMSGSHSFEINPVKTVLYGKCADCQ